MEQLNNVPDGQVQRAILRVVLSSEVRRAVEEWRKRQARATHPDGTFDRKRRWYPSEAEKQTCCGSVRNPSAAWPFSLITHCRSRDHVINLFRVSRAEFNLALRIQKQLTEKEGGEENGKE